MRRFLIALGITSCLLFIFVAPLPADAALVPIVCQDPEHCGTCEFVELINNVIQFILIVSSGVAVLIFIFAGFRLLFSGGNVQAATVARSMLTNVIIGYVIVLAAFLVIDTVMGFLLPGNSPNLGWKTVKCVYPIEAHETAQPGSIDVGGGYNVEAPIAGNCSVDNFVNAGVPTNLASTFACLTGPESACNLNAQNSWTSARGVLQITRGQNDTCHNLNVPSCTEAARAAGFDITGNLNCSQAFTGGTKPSNPSRAKPGMDTLFNACNAAAANFKCNAQAALCLYNDAGSFSPWTADPRSGKQKACINKYK